MIERENTISVNMLPYKYGESTSKTSENLCSKCFQKCARGISHPCLKSKKNTS